MKFQKEYRALTEIQEQNPEGLLLVDDVIETARDEDSVLHRHFEWDDSLAAQEHRRHQARALIQRVQLPAKIGRADNLPAFVSLPEDRLRKGGGYRPVQEVLDDHALLMQHLRELERKIDYFITQAELFNLATQAPLREFKQKLETLRDDEHPPTI